MLRSQYSTVLYILLVNIYLIRVYELGIQFHKIQNAHITHYNIVSILEEEASLFVFHAQPLDPTSNQAARQWYSWVFNSFPSTSFCI